MPGDRDHPLGGPEKGTPQSPLLRLKNLSKTFADIKVLNALRLDVAPGEVHAIVGQNGSGKSTIVKLLAGYHHADPGAEFWYREEPVHQDELSRKLRFVHQDLGLVSELSAVENLALRQALIGVPRRRRRRDHEILEAQELLRSLGLLAFDVTRPLAEASILQRTIVAIACALRGWDSEAGGILVLDEPTAVMPPKEADIVLKVARDLSEAGAGVIHVSHRLDEIFEVSDRVTILRNGQHVRTCSTAGITKAEMVQLMVGADINPDYRYSRPSQVGARRPVLEAEGVAGRYLHSASFALHESEILGVVGLPDSGRDELPWLLGDRSGAAIGGRVRESGHSGDWVELAHRQVSKVALLPVGCENLDRRC